MLGVQGLGADQGPVLCSWTSHCASLSGGVGHFGPLLSLVIYFKIIIFNNCFVFLEIYYSVSDTSYSEFFFFVSIFFINNKLLDVFLQPVQANNLEEFVKHLTTEMHQRIPNSLVIWYDSVTYKGDLAWQDELNANNR